MPSAPDHDLLSRLEALYGRAFLRRLVVSGEEAMRVAARGGEPPPEIIARVKLRDGRAVLATVEAWRPI